MNRLFSAIGHLISERIAPRTLPLHVPTYVPITIEEIEDSFTIALVVQQLERPLLIERLDFPDTIFHEVSIELSILFSPKFEVLEVADTIELLAWLQSQIPLPIFYEISLLFRPSAHGKTYIEEEGVQEKLFEDEPQGPCIHQRFPDEDRRNCAICRKKEEEKKRAEAKRNIFDLILPLLYPTHLPNGVLPYVIPPGEDLYPFQRVGIDFLVKHEAALLADEMGLGKTVQAIMAIRILIREGKTTHVLVILPVALMATWEGFLREWAPELTYKKVRGQSEIRYALWRTLSHVYLVSYETLREDIENGHLDTSSTYYDLIIYDEIQKIKNPNSKTSIAIRKLSTKKRWGLSGTPLENRVDDLVTVIRHISPRQFDTRYPREWEVKQAVRELMLRRRKKAVLSELPEIKLDDEFIELTPQQWRSYDLLEQRGILDLKAKGEEITIQHVFQLIIKLKQICNFDPTTGQSAKLERLLDILEDIRANDEKALVFTQFVESALKVLKEGLSNYSPLVYHGSMNQRERDDVVRVFTDDPSKWLLIMSIKAGGMGLNLQIANNVIHFDHWWNPATLDQASARVHRIGQKKTVFVTNFIAKDTIEDRIQEIIKRKRRDFKEYIDDQTGEIRSASLNEKELFGLFGLEPPKRGKTPSTLEKGEELERLCKILFERQGWRVTQTKKTRDGGIDLFASKRTELGSEKIIVQCKNHIAKVDVSTVRELAGILEGVHNKGYLISTSGFTREAYRFAEARRIELIDGDRLEVLLEKYAVK